jgi:hypothetical protein
MWAAAAASLALIAGGGLAYGQLSGTFAIFTAETENQGAVFQGGWVSAATGLSAPQASGNGEYFTWTVGSNGVTAQEVYFADQGTTSNCTGASYTHATTGAAGANALSSGATSVDGANAGTSDDVPAANVGDYICYQIRSTHGVWWTPANIGSAVQVGLVPLSIAFSAPGSGSMVTNNTFTIVFNHNFTYSSGTINVVATLGNPGTLSFPGIGSVSGGNITKGGSCNASTVSGTGTTTMTIKLSGCPTGGNKIAVVAGGTGTYTASGTNVASTIGPAGHAFSVNQCNQAAPCKPQMTY